MVQPRPNLYTYGAVSLFPPPPSTGGGHTRMRGGGGGVPIPTTEEKA
jgi:hypothetical protein